MKLIWKLAVPQLCIVVLVGLISFTVIFSSINKMKEQYVKDVVEGRFDFITKEIEISSQQSVIETSVFVRLPAVLRAYELALSGNINDPFSPQSQAARELLRRELAPMLEGHFEVTGNRLRLHFHLPNGFSLVRLWRDKNSTIDGVWVDYSDDVRGYRPTLMEVNRTGRIVMGIEAGSGGFAIRGVVPVFTKDDRQVGSAEILQDFQPILDIATVEGLLSYYLYINKELVNLSVELQDDEKYPSKGDFVRLIEAKDTLAETLISADFLSKGKTGIYYEYYPSLKRTLATYPLGDYLGNQTAVIVCVMDTSKVTGLENTAAFTLIIMLACAALLPTFALLIQMSRLATKPINMIKSKIQDIAEDRAILTEQIPSRQKDEIGDLAKWFNTLTAKLNTILEERQKMIRKISAESEKYEETAHWYRSILNSVPFPISVQDADMNWTFFNTALEKVLGKKLKDAAGKPCSEWGLSICNTPDCAVECAKINRRQTYFVYKGASYQVDVEILKDLQGEITGFIEVIQDITNTEHLIKQQMEAKAANEAKSFFLANMSHEIRTPMNAIIGMTSIGLSADDPERMTHCFRKIENASKHLLGIINDILDMSKIEAGKFELSSAEFDFENMLHRVIGVINFRVDEKKQKLKVNIDKNIPKNLIGDDQRLAQVITNLLSNAVKFTPEEGVISLDCVFSGEENGICKLQFTVTDTGIGISREQQARLFQAFQQADSNTSHKFGGTGLGLAISKRIIEMMEGGIRIESELGKGASFIFTVKMERGQNQKLPSADFILSHEEKANIFEGRRILLADDVEINRDIVLALLEPTRLITDCAENGIQAVGMFSEAPEKYDMIFMDVKMPEMDGYEATRRIRSLENEKAKTIPIIAMTANVFREDIDKCMEAGMNAHIGKPLIPSDLMQILQQYLS